MNQNQLSDATEPRSVDQQQACSPLDNIRYYGCEAHVDLFYPRNEGNAKVIVVGLSDVRAADSIRVSYDFERDGWKIEQASVFEWEASDSICDPDWQEVAFISAWGREASAPVQPADTKPTTTKGHATT